MRVFRSLNQHLRLQRHRCLGGCGKRPCTEVLHAREADIRSVVPWFRKAWMEGAWTE